MIEDDLYLRIAVITGTHGLRGRLKVFIITDIHDRFKEESNVFIKEKNGYIQYRIVEFIESKGSIGLLKLQGIDTIEDAAAHKTQEIFIEKTVAENTRPQLEEETYYYYEIIGCSVYLDGNLFGRVEKIMQGGSGEILIVSDAHGRRHMIPFVESMVDTKNLKKQRIDIYPVEGLLDI